MTAARQERKSPCGRAVLAALILAYWRRRSAGAATTELVVINRYTGLAIDGFDPVAYFADAKPQLGRAELELRFGGATWRFHNEGNRAAFAAAPDVYAPRFGGYDPVALARGAPTAGHPELWLIGAAALSVLQRGRRTRLCPRPRRRHRGRRAEMARDKAHLGPRLGQEVARRDEASDAVVAAAIALAVTQCAAVGPAHIAAGGAQARA